MPHSAQEPGCQDGRWRIAVSLPMFGIDPVSGDHLMRPPALLAAALALCASASVPIAPAQAAGLNTASAAHRAIYNLTLSSSRGGEVVAATSTMG